MTKLLLSSLTLWLFGTNAFTAAPFTSRHDTTSLSAQKETRIEESRRTLFSRVAQQSLTAGILFTSSIADAAEVTDRIYMDVKGGTFDTPQRIVIGLYGKEAPQATKMLKALMTQQGLPAPCKPKEIRSLQKEQLEANKVYNACIEGEDQGVNYDFATIWRVIKDERIDVGAVSGRFVAREFPTWEGRNELRHSEPGVVSVRRGNDSGFGFVIYPGKDGSNAAYLDENHVVVGKVLEGLDVVEAINQVPVVTSSFSGGPPKQLAPDRSCRYGGNKLYCNENKPLQKLSIVSSGVL